MRYKILKYPIISPETGEIKKSLILTKGSEILSIAEQRGLAVLYVKTPLQVPENEMWEITMAGTGHIINIDESWKFIGTVNLSDGTLMFHIWVRKGAL